MSMNRLHEREDKMIEAIEGCQQLLALLWKYLRELNRPAELEKVREVVCILRTIERNAEDELTELRLQSIVAQNDEQ